MSEGTIRPQVADLTDFLIRRDPGAVAALRSKYPGHEEQAMLSERVVLAPLSPVLKAQVDLAQSALATYLQMWARVAPLIQEQIHRANIWKLVGAALATLGSGAALTHLLGLNEEKTLAAVSCAVALVGGLIGLTVRFLQQDLLGHDGGLTEHYLALSRGAASAIGLQLSLKPFADVNDDDARPDEVRLLVGQANKLVSEVDAHVAALPNLFQSARSGQATT